MNLVSTVCFLQKSNFYITKTNVEQQTKVCGQAYLSIVTSYSIIHGSLRLCEAVEDMSSLLLREADLAIIAVQVTRRQISQQAGYMYHMPGVRVCQPEDRLPELHPTDTLGLVWPGSQYCTALFVHCVQHSGQLNSAFSSIMAIACARLQTSQIIKKISKWHQQYIARAQHFLYTVISVDCHQGPEATSIQHEQNYILQPNLLLKILKKILKIWIISNSILTQ